MVRVGNYPFGQCNGTSKVVNRKRRIEGIGSREDNGEIATHVLRNAFT